MMPLTELKLRMQITGGDALKQIVILEAFWSVMSPLKRRLAVELPKMVSCSRQAVQAGHVASGHSVSIGNTFAFGYI